MVTEKRAGFSWTDQTRNAVNGKIQVGQTALEYTCYGPPPDAAPTIVMLHEGLGSVALWQGFPRQIAHETGYGVFVYARANHGASDPVDLPRPLDSSHQHAIDDLPKILDQIGLQKGILLGHSDGATIAAIYAGSVPDYRIRGLILMAPHFFTEPVGLAAIEQAKQAYITGNLRTRMAKYHANPDNCFWGWNDVWLDPEFRDWNVADVIDHLRIPVLALQGREDQYGTLAQIKEIETRIYAPVEVGILDNCRHAPHLDQPEQTLSLIKDFLARLAKIESQTIFGA